MSSESKDKKTSSSERSEANTAGESPTTATSNGHPDPVKRNTKIVLYVALFLFVWYVLAARQAPWTDQARVQGYIVSIAPKVSGRVKQVNVDLDQEVHGGDLLVLIDPKEYELTLERARTELELAGQETGAGTAAVATAQANLVEAQAHLNHMQVQARRIYEVEKRGVVPKAEGDQARATVKQARAQVDVARANLEKAKQELGQAGENNPRIRAAIAKLKKAQINLAETKVVAPGHGMIANLQIDEGHYASKGTPLMTFVSASDVWVEAYMRENSIGKLKPGSSVDVALDSAPGKVFPATVISIGVGIEHDSSGKLGGLATIKGDSGWLRSAQRFPVIIRFSDESATGYRRHGGQADVQIYGSNWILNGMGWLWIRLMTLLSFIY